VTRPLKVRLSNEYETQIWINSLLYEFICYSFCHGKLERPLEHQLKHVINKESSTLMSHFGIIKFVIFFLCVCWSSDDFLNFQDWLSNNLQGISVQKILILFMSIFSLTERLTTNCGLFSDELCKNKKLYCRFATQHDGWSFTST